MGSWDQMLFIDFVRLRTRVSCIPNVGHDMKRAVMGSVLVLPWRSAKGKTGLTGLLGASVAGQVPVRLSRIHSGQESCKLDNLCFLLVGEERGAELSKNPQNTHEKKHGLLIPATGQKAWSQQMTGPVIQNFPVTLRPSETMTGETGEAEISKAGTGGKIKHNLFPKLRLPVCSWPCLTLSHSWNLAFYPGLDTLNTESETEFVS